MYGPLSREQEFEIFQAYRETKSSVGRIEIRNRIVLSNLGLAFKEALYYKNIGLDIRDLVQEGTIGLIIAVDRFDHTKGFKFSTYATPWVKQSILAHLQEMIGTVKISSHLLNLINKVKAVWPNLQDPSEISKECDLSINQVEKILSILNFGYSSMDTSLNEDGVTLHEFLSARSADPLTEYIGKDIKEKIQQAIDGILNEREEKIVRMRFGITGGEI